MKRSPSGILSRRPHSRRRPWENTCMTWKTPKIVEVSLALEINSYVCAEIG
jgi:coenzyme PQQ precursor peptide PqqA